MSRQVIQALESKLDELIDLCDQLDRENRILKKDADSWKAERENLMEKNATARSKVEAMIQRLRALEQET